MPYEAIVIGVSAGGLQALTSLLEGLPSTYPLPIIITQHRSKDEGGLLADVLQARCRIRIKEADEKEAIAGGTVYLAPAGYHLLVEKDRHFSLSCDPPVHYARPSIDVLFETAADVFENRLIGIILTGANADGAAGIQKIRRLGGLTIAQEPGDASFPAMPRAAIATGSIQQVLGLNAIKAFLSDTGRKQPYYE
jgi:two-component system chemotaxis response regulator CheB